MKRSRVRFTQSTGKIFGKATLGIGVAAASLIAGCQLSGSGSHPAASMATAQIAPGGFGATGSASSSELAASPALSATPAAPTVNTPATQVAAQMQMAFEQVAKTAEPAVVTITTLQRIPAPPRGSGGMPFPFSGAPRGGRGRQVPGGSGGDGSDPLEQFFRQFQQDYGREPGSWNPGAGGNFAGTQSGFYRTQAAGPLVGAGLGSGFLIRPDGLILTNAHVVKDADRVTVKLSDGREFRDAKVLGQDARTDIAVVKIPANNLPTIPLGDSSSVNVGDWAIAVGNPFGLEHTLTTGVISAKSRQVPLSDSGPGDYLQTDASINPGNSGGPLLDIYGRVIGINNAIYSESGGNVGIGFAIPISTARTIADVLARGERIRRARLGVAVTDIGDQAAAFGLPAGTKGALIESIEPGSPASKAGLAAGDVVTSIDGKPVANSADLQTSIAAGKIGSTVTMQTLHGGSPGSVTVTLDEAKDDTAAAASTSQSRSPGAKKQANQAPKLGIALTELTPEIVRELGLKPGATGVVIAAVQPGSPAQVAGLRGGDVIQRVGQATVLAPPDVRKAVDQILAKQPEGDQRGVALYVVRGGEGQYVVVGL